MASNVLTTVVFSVQVVLGCYLCTPGTSAYIPYEISSSNQAVLQSASTFLLRFESHVHNRFRRQSNNVGGADAATNSGANGQTLPDESSQPVSPDSTVSVKNTSTTSPSASATTVSPTVTPTTPKVQSTEGLKDGTSTTESNPFDEADILHDHYDYYTSDVISNKFSEHWIELENAPRHETLSTVHRVAAVISLMFDFYFYGHKVTNVTIATGGFMYMSPFLHQWLTATQYIAPLMANFDPSFSKDSNIYVQNEKNRIIIEWQNIVLKDQNATGRFHFQAILNEDSSIKFVYKSIPFPVANISHEEHPVKVGLSDAYYNDTYIAESNIKRRTIYEYHKVALPTSWVKTGSVIILTPLPTCNRISSCDSCIQHVGVKFDCRWCSTLGRCSNGFDWYRQHWDREGCQISDGKCSKKSEFPVAVVVIVVLIVVGALAGVVGWVYYAYTNPTSRSGMWLMEHRPSQIKSKIKFWKSSSDSGTKYKVESEA